MKSLAEQSGILGRVTFRNYDIQSDRAREIDHILRTAHDIPSEVWKALTNELWWLCQSRAFETSNLVVLTGRALIARRLIGDLTYSGTIDYGALGTDATAVNAADTTLGTEVARKLFARRTRTNAQANFDFFYSQADTDGTYEEFGMVVDGTATADTGQLFNHALTGGWTKTNTEAMTVSVTININP
jgi:hypothetical protein